MSRPWPVEIRLPADRRHLIVSFDNDVTRMLAAERLRVESPSAEVQGHAPQHKKHVTGKENVQITGIEPVGNYAVRLTFDDGHDTGIYTWDFLYGFDQDRAAAGILTSDK